MANPNPKNKFQKGHARLAGAGRPTGSTNVLTRDIKSLLREAAANTGFMERVPVLDAAGKPTGQFEHKWGKGGELGYLEWLARNHPGYFAALYGKLIPLDVNQKGEEKTVVHYETVEERRAAMIAKGWAPATLAALEEAMEPKFLRDMREENEGQGEAMIAAAPDMLKALRTIEFDVRGRCTACFGWDGSSENDHKHATDCIVASAIAKATGT